MGLFHCRVVHVCICVAVGYVFNSPNVCDSVYFDHCESATRRRAPQRWARGTPRGIRRIPVPHGSIVHVHTRGRERRGKRSITECALVIESSAMNERQQWTQSTSDRSHRLQMKATSTEMKVTARVNNMKRAERVRTCKERGMARAGVGRPP